MLREILYLNALRKRKKLDDEYVNWLRFANAGMLDPGNAYCLDYAIRNLPTSNPVIEIGSFCGLSTNIITYLLNKYDKKSSVITSDKWIFEGAEKGGDIGNSISHADYKTYVMDTFKRNVQFFSAGNIPYPIEVFSDEFFEMWGKGTDTKDLFGRDIHLGGKISCAYIDGNHTYEFSKRDYENVAKYLDVGGFILFDDSADYNKWGCAELMKEVKNNPDFKLCMKNPNYLFQKIK